MLTFSLPVYGMENLSQDRIDFMCSVGTYEPFECMKIEPVTPAIPMVVDELESTEMSTSEATATEDIQRQQMLETIEQLQRLIEQLTIIINQINSKK